MFKYFTFIAFCIKLKIFVFMKQSGVQVHDEEQRMIADGSPKFPNKHSTSSKNGMLRIKDKIVTVVKCYVHTSHFLHIP